MTGLFVNMVGLAQQIDDGELNLVLHFEDFDPAALAAVLGEADVVRSDGADVLRRTEG